KQSGTGKVTQALERELNEFRRRISSSNVKSTVEQTEYRTSITLELEGATSKAISADLHDALNNLLRDAKISPSFIYTEFMPGVGIEKNVGKAGRIKDEQKDNDSLANFISVKMRERGYSDAVTLAQQAGVLPITVRRIMNGDYTRCPNQTTIIKLASALGITEEEFRSKL
ncbi:MAG: helix-turn-helix transcriptional regulator, partial [Nanoarchaeota archaeon]